MAREIEVELTEPDGWPHTDEEALAFASFLPARIPLGHPESEWIGHRIRKVNGVWYITMTHEPLT